MITSSPRAFALVMYGWGGKTLDTVLSGNGTGRLVARMATLGVKTRLLDWNDWDAAEATVRAHPKSDPLIIGGTSLGANGAPWLAQRVAPRRIDYMFGIQPSLWGVEFKYPPTVVRATCIYNPTWILTFGLGARILVRAPGNVETLVKYVKSYSLHPGDAAESVQRTILDDISEVLHD